MTDSQARPWIKTVTHLRACRCVVVDVRHRDDPDSPTGVTVVNTAATEQAALDGILLAIAIGVDAAKQQSPDNCAGLVCNLPERFATLYREDLLDEPSAGDALVLIEKTGAVVSPPAADVVWTHPWCMELDCTPPEFMSFAFVGLYGGFERVVVRADTRAHLDKFLAQNNFRDHPRFRKMTVTGPHGFREETTREQVRAEREAARRQIQPQEPAHAVSANAESAVGDGA